MTFIRIGCQKLTASKRQQITDWYQTHTQSNIGSFEFVDATTCKTLGKGDDKMEDIDLFITSLSNAIKNITFICCYQKGYGLQYLYAINGCVTETYKIDICDCKYKCYCDARYNLEDELGNTPDYLIQIDSKPDLILQNEITKNEMVDISSLFN